MQPLPSGSRRSTRLTLVAAGLVVLLGVVAFASRSGFGHAGKASPSNAYISYAYTVFLILFVAMIPVTIYAWIARAREADLRDRPSAWRRFVRSIVSFLLFVLAAYAIYKARAHFHLVRHSPAGKVPPPGTRHGHGKGQLAQAAQQQNPAFEWIVLWVALGLAAVGAVALFVLWRRWQQRMATPGPIPGPREELAATISDAIEDLEREPDPRRAVIAAYARMERVLGRQGLGRRPSETAIEYMRRVLVALTTQVDAVERLTGLFERAKFSNHPVTDEMKHDAIAALRRIREGMAT